MTYDEAMVVLQLNHIYPDKQVLVTKRGNQVVGLEIPCAPIMMDTRKSHIEKILEGKGFRVDKLSNLGYLLVTKTNQHEC